MIAGTKRAHAARSRARCVPISLGNVVLMPVTMSWPSSYHRKDGSDSRPRRGLIAQGPSVTKASTVVWRGPRHQKHNAPRELQHSVRGGLATRDDTSDYQVAVGDGARPSDAADSPDRCLSEYSTLGWWPKLSSRDRPPLKHPDTRYVYGIFRAVDDHPLGMVVQLSALYVSTKIPMRWNVVANERAGR